MQSDIDGDGTMDFSFKLANMPEFQFADRLAFIL